MNYSKVGGLNPILSIVLIYKGCVCITFIYLFLILKKSKKHVRIELAVSQRKYALRGSMKKRDLLE